jgi:hypothetical protein
LGSRLARLPERDDGDDRSSTLGFDHAALISRDGLAGPATVERSKRREYSRAFLDYGLIEGPFSVFADGRRRREPGLTGGKSPQRLSRDCRVAVISAEGSPARRRPLTDG